MTVSQTGRRNGMTLTLNVNQGFCQPFQRVAPGQGLIPVLFNDFNELAGPRRQTPFCQ